MSAFAPELRLLYALLLNAAVFGGAWRFVRRANAGGVAQRWGDALLLYFLIQYASVCLPGLAGVLNVWSLSAVAAALGAACAFLPRARAAAPGEERRPNVESLGHTGGGPVPAVVSERPSERLWQSSGAAVAFALGYLAAALYLQRFPLLSEDAMTYHLPAAVQWLRSGRLGLFDAWYFNPANTYSPLAGSAFAAWLIAPLGNGLLVQWVQAPALLMVLALMVRLCRSAGGSPAVSAVVAAAAVLSRPLLSELTLAKDDLFLCAFFLAALVGCSGERLKDPLGPWRVGTGLGLMLATKYTALFTLPIFLLLIDAPFRAGWGRRQWGAAAAMVLLLAGPWYARNAVLAGNPLFPLDVSVLGSNLFAGLFSTHRSADLGAWPGVWKVFTGRHFSMPPVVLVALGVGWVAALASGAGRTSSRRGLAKETTPAGPFLRQPLVRACLFGPVVGIVLFLFGSPYAEIRFVFPSFLLLFGCCAVALRPRGKASSAKSLALPLSAAGALLAAAALTAFADPAYVAVMSGAGCAAAAGHALLVYCARRMPAPDRNARGVLIALACAAPAAGIWVYWNAYAGLVRGLTETDPADPDRAAGADGLWRHYGPIAEAWGVVRNPRLIPPGATLAYANTHVVYPLLGFDHARALVYAPTNPALAHVGDLPHFPHPVAGEEMIRAVVALQADSPDEGAWLGRLRRSEARYLFVARHDAGEDPRELRFASAHPAQFKVVFQNSAAVVYAIVWDAGDGR